MMGRSVPLVLLFGVVAAASAGQPAPSAEPPAPGKTPAPMPAAAARAMGLGAAVRAEIDAVLRALEDGADFADGAERLGALFDRVVAYAPTRDVALFRDAALAARLVRLAAEAEPGRRAEWLGYLRRNERLGTALAFLFDPEHDDGPAVLRVLDGLRTRFDGEPGGVLETHAGLVAALCVVHDRPPRLRVRNGAEIEVVEAPPPEELFAYFRRHERAMVFPPRQTPAELLVYVVDVNASVEELEWALDRYRENRQVGQRYHDVNYDTAFFKRNADKKLWGHAYTLPNILRFGGVCGDQAYFACHVGKAIGVPTAMVTGRGGVVGHAWVGFLEATGRRAWWNFDAGRWEEYEDVRGTVEDPQTGQRISDGELALLAEGALRGAAARERAIALTDAAARLAGVIAADAPWPPEAPAGAGAARPANGTAVLALAEAAVEACPTHRPAWMLVRAESEAGRMEPEQVKRWGDALARMCGDAYPDFACATLSPLIGTVDDPREQDRLWNWAAERFRLRPDLVASVRLRQARMWEAQRDRNRAWACYEDVIRRFANDGPFVVEAVAAAERLLIEGGRDDMILEFYQDAWRRVFKPRGTSEVFRGQSNWFRIGSMYAQWLERAGRHAQAAAVRRQLGVDG